MSEIADWERVKSIFGEVVDLPASEQSAAIERLCAGNAELSDAVRRFLESHHAAGDFLGRPTLGGEVGSGSSAELPERIDGYVPLEIIGEGGFGTVYRALQEAPVRRTVALKVIKAGMDTREVIARFRGERQALAMMSHPNIAAVLDAGATREGRPYFVMEYVPGEPISAYCDGHSLSIADRLRLFVQVCHAVQHAHQRGIIHRDIKPSNVLVVDDLGEDDGLGAASRGVSRALAKVIDFGVAKAINEQITNASLMTREGVILGTPEYMSPEQIDAGEIDIDTRTDIYSLGVLLYELLTGTQPFNRRSLRVRGDLDIRRLVREIEPPRPSVRLRESATFERGKGQVEAPGAGAGEFVDRDEKSARSPTSIARIARLRRVDPRTLLRSVRGDLDWIVMKCLEKDRDRRYETPSALAAEIERYLNHEPVSAGPPGAGYRLRKFARRNRVAITIITVAVVGLVASITGLVAAVRAREVADAQRSLADGQRTLAQRNAQAANRAARKAEAVNAFIRGMISEADPRQSAKRDVTMRESLDRAVAKLDAGEMRDQPEIEAAIRVTIGRSFAGLARFEAADAQLSEAVRILTEQGGEGSADFAEALHERGGARKLAGRAEDSEKDLRRALTIFRGQGESKMKQVMACANDLALALLDQRRFKEAEPLLMEVLVYEREHAGESGSLLAEVVNNLGSLHLALNDFDEAGRWFEEAIEINRRALGRVHPTVATNLDNLAQTLQAKGDTNGAEAAFGEALSIRRTLLGSKHPDVATTLHNLAVLHFVRGDTAKCESELRESYAIFREIYGLVHGDTQLVQDSLVSVLGGAGKYDEVEALLLESFKAYGAGTGPDLTRQRKLAARLVQLYQAWAKEDKVAEWSAVLERCKSAQAQADSQPSAGVPEGDGERGDGSATPPPD